MPTVLDATVVNQAYDTSGNGGRKLVRLSNGWLVAGMKNGTTDVKFYKSEDNGQTWSLLTTIAESNPSLSMVAKGTDIYVLLAYSTVVRAYKIDGLTGARSSFMSVDSGQNSVGECSLAINETGTELHAAWASKNSTHPNSFNIRYAKGTINADGIVTWGAVEQVTYVNSSSIPNAVINPSIIIVNNTPAIIVEQQSYVFASGGTTPGYGVTILKRDSTLSTNSSVVNSNWSYKVIYSVSGYTQSRPSACVDKNGRIWVAWDGADSVATSVNNIRVAYSDDGGESWAVTKITNSTSTSSHFMVPSITVNKDNEIFIVCRNGSSSPGWDLVYLKYDGSLWSQTLLKDANVTTGANPLSPSALFDLSLNFSVPLLIYQDNSKVGFYGTWVANTISVTSGYIGQKTSADKSNILTYSITTDGEMSDIIEKINDVTIATRTNPTSGQEFMVSLSQAQWDVIKYGNGHTLIIEMDGDTWTYTFDKRLNANDDILSAVKGVQDLETHLNGIKEQLAETIRAKGGTVNDADAWSAFVNAVANMQSKRWASGTGVTSSTSMTFTFADGNSSPQYPLEVTGLSFRPSIVLIYSTIDTSYVTVLFPENLYTNNSNPIRILLLPYSTLSTSTGTGYSYRLEGNAYVSDGAFRLPYQSANRAVNWIAIE